MTSRRPAPGRSRRTHVAGLCAVSAVGLAGCFTGERPTLGPPPAPTGDTNADAVLDRLDAGTSAAFDASYTISSPRGGQARAAVHQESRDRRTVTIGSVEFAVDGRSTSTCEAGASTPDACADSIDAALVSDLGVTPDFYAASAAARLRSDVARRVGPTTASTETIGGQPATCVAVPVDETQVSVCAVDGGPLARLASTDVTIELVELTR